MPTRRVTVDEPTVVGGDPEFCPSGTARVTVKPHRDGVELVSIERTD